MVPHLTIMFSNSLDRDIMASTASRLIESFRRSLNTRMVWYLVETSTGSQARRMHHDTTHPDNHSSCQLHGPA